MKLVLDANVHRDVVQYLRTHGYEIISIFEEHRGASDTEVINISKRYNVPIVTHDKDFGNLVYYQRQKCPGMLLVRIESVLPKDLFTAIQKVLQQTELFGNFVVIDDNNLRIRKLL